MPRKHCHHMIRSTAREMAGALYEELMRDNTRYAAFKALCAEHEPKAVQARFIALMWPHLVEQARQTLATLLTTNIPEGNKEAIANALILDNELRPQRPSALQ